jgi:hypothetical protein
MIVEKDKLNIDILRDLLRDLFEDDTKIYTTPSGDYQIVTDDDIPIEYNDTIINMIRSIPSNANKCVKYISSGGTSCCHYGADIWWSCDNHCNTMDGKYIVLDFKLDPLPSYIKECNCVKRRSDVYVYHMRDISMAVILSEGLHIPLVVSTIMKFSPDARYDSIWETVIRWGNSPVKVSWYDKLSLNKAISIRHALSLSGIPSLMTIDFDGKYIVFRATDGNGGSMSASHLYPLQSIEVDDISELVMGWESNDEWIGFM